MDTDNFYSIDRLVEFGLGMAVAQQMVNSMNHALTNSHIPGAMNPMGGRIPTNYHVVIDGKPAGPFTEEEISKLITAGKVTKSTYVWKFGMPKWELAENMADVLKLVAMSPPPFTPEI